MSEAGLTARTAEQLQDALLENIGLPRFLDRVAEHGATAFGVGAGISCAALLVRGGRERMSSGGQGRAVVPEELQNPYDDGPSLSALRTGETVLVEDVLAELRWPDLMKAAAASGFGSILAVPLLLPDPAAAAAALSFYHRRAYGFPAPLRAGAVSYAAAAAKSLVLAERLDRLARRAADLEAALESRTTINLAAGIVMGQNSCNHVEAMQILRRASNARNIKLRDLAREIVEPLTGRPVTRFDG